MEQDFFEQMYEEIGVSLSPIQKQAVMHTEGPLLLLASPGSGKTTTINMRIGYLIRAKGIDPSRILAVTFSRASARDMRERFKKFFPSLPADSVHFSTIHSFAFEVVREGLRKKGISYQMIEGEVDKEKAKEGEQADQPVLHKNRILRNIFLEVVGESITEDQMDELGRYIGYIKNKLIPFEDIKDIETGVPSADVIYSAYEAFKTKDPDNLLVDYDDMLTLANQILEEDELILTKYRKKFDYFLTDESQDTSLVQNRIVEKLVKPKNNLCVVADDDQSIYGFRGAEPSYLLNFAQIYPNATILTMAQNYRSTKDIVDVSNRFIKRNKDRYDKNMFTENQADQPINIKSFPSYQAQLDFLVEELKELENLHDVAILYRNNSSSIALINALDYAGIPFYMKDTDNKFFTHWLVEDILNFMRMTYTDKKVGILEKIHSKCMGYISKKQIAFLKTMENDESVFDNLLNHFPIETYQKTQLEELKELFPKMNSMAPKKVIQMIRSDLGYEKSIEKMCKLYGFNKEFLFGMLNTLERIAGNLETILEFVNRLTYLKDLMRTSKFNKSKNVITLSTFHSSKGLEYEHVYMIDLVNGVIPSSDDLSSWEKGDRVSMEEAVRLFYVGMTRAKRYLHLFSYDKKDGERVKKSLFVQNVEEIMYPNRNKVKKVAKPAKASTVVLDPRAILDRSLLQSGLTIHHAVFGEGVIENVDSMVIKIRFGSAGMKQLAIEACLEKGLLLKAE